MLRLVRDEGEGDEIRHGEIAAVDDSTQEMVFVFHGGFRVHVKRTNLTPEERGQIEDTVLFFLRRHGEMLAMAEISAILQRTAVEILNLGSKNATEELASVGVRAANFKEAKETFRSQAVSALLRMQRMGVRYFDTGIGHFGGTPEDFLKKYQ
ncbi:hypothetical protein HZA42_05000 [Candidatus Peregrinibacteria bacterium]|nr:hypothetical protein [Candidatus Peregrinibacteria bacterium]